MARYLAPTSAVKQVVTVDCEKMGFWKRMADGDETRRVKKTQ